MLKFEEIGQKWQDISTELRKESIAFIKEMVKTHGTIDCLEEDDYLSVSYDGGNHPEYASNCFSLVHGIFLDEKENVMLDTEDDTEYDIQEIPTEEVYRVATFVKSKFEPKTKAEISQEDIDFVKGLLDK